MPQLEETIKKYLRPLQAKPQSKSQQLTNSTYDNGRVNLIVPCIQFFYAFAQMKLIVEIFQCLKFPFELYRVAAKKSHYTLRAQELSTSLACFYVFGKHF